MFSRKREKGSNGYAIPYKEAFSLRDEIGMCPNMEVEIDVTDKPDIY